MKLYRCKVLLAGNRLNEVHKDRITAAEIMMLRFVHGGDDAVINIKEIGEDKQRTSEGEREHLRQQYASVIAKTERGEIEPVTRLFGPDHLPLPGSLPNLPVQVEPEQIAGMLD